MIVLLVSFELIQVAYLQQIDPQQHVVVEEKTPGVFTAIKNGAAWREIVHVMMKFKEGMMEDENDNKLGDIVFVCFSGKGKAITQPILKAISQDFQSHLLYFWIDKQTFKGVPFNRAFLRDRQICYGEGFSQLRHKQELRVAVGSALKGEKQVQYVFLEKNPVELKQLKKEGFLHVVDDLSPHKLRDAIEKAQSFLQSRSKADEPTNEVQQAKHKFPFAQEYISSLAKNFKQIPVKAISPFAKQKLSIQSFLQQLYSPSVYYNITPKSWIPRPLSKEVCSYVFHNASDGELYIAQSAKPKDHSSQEQYELKILNRYLGYLLEPNSLAVPHDKHCTLMKYCKIKGYQNKKAFLNIRPYIEQLRTLNQLNLTEQDYSYLVKEGQLRGRKVKGLAAVILGSWLVNESFDIKNWSEQVCLVQANSMDGSYSFVNKDTINNSEGQLVLCRTDYFRIFNSATFKIVQPQNIIILHRFPQKQVTLSLSDLGSSHLQQISVLLKGLNSEREQMIKNIFIYYRWHTRLAEYYEIFRFRLAAIRSYFQHQTNLPIQRTLLIQYPKLACLLMPQNYDKFMVPQENDYFPLEYTFKEEMVVKKTMENPYLSYISKACSFAIYNIDFPVFSFLQWVKSTNKYHIIEYASMLNHTIEQIQILDKRLKLQGLNDKKNVLLVVDHMELAQAIVDKPKGVKTVMIFRLKKISQLGDIGLITAKMQRRKSIEESENKLLLALNRWGLESQLFSSKFQLYEWILQTVIKIKCQLYGLPFQNCVQFISTLHKSISTNKNRLKQLQQAHKEQSNYLYSYPIVKDNQKIVLNYSLFEYFHMRTLINQILSGKWSHKLLPYQNYSLSCLRQFVDAELGVKVVNKLIQYLNLLAEQKLDGYTYQSSISDTLQVIKTLTSNSKSIENQEQVYALYYEVFAEVVKIYNYFKIKATLLIDGVFVVVNDESIQFIRGNNSCKMVTEDNQVISVASFENKLLFVTSQQNQLILNEVSITKEPQLSYRQMSKLRLNSNQLKILLLEQWQKILIHKHTNHIAFILYRSKEIVLLYLNLVSQQVTQSKRYHFESELISCQVLSSPEPILLMADYQSLYSVQLAPDASLNALITLFTVDYGLSNLFYCSIDNNLHVFSYKLHISQHTILNKNQIVNRKRLEFPRNIKTMSFKEQKLLIFYENCDTLDIFHYGLNPLKRVHTAFWVDPSVQQIALSCQELYLKGESYVKHIRLKSRSFLEGQLISEQ